MKFLLIYLFILPSSTQAELFTSIAHLKSLIDVHKEIPEIIESYIKIEENRLQTLQRFFLFEIFINILFYLLQVTRQNFFSIFSCYVFCFETFGKFLIRNIFQCAFLILNYSYFSFTLLIYFFHSLVYFIFYLENFIGFISKKVKRLLD